MRSALLAIALLLAGCLGAANAPAGRQSLALSLDARLADAPPFAQDHDHFDAALHNASANVRLVGYHSLAPGSDGVVDASKRDGSWMNSEIIVRGHYAFVGYLGAPWILGIVDVSDAARPKLVSLFPDANTWTMDLAVSEDGNWVFVSAYPGAIGSVYERDYLAKTLAPPDGVSAPGVLVIDARDKAHPQLSSFFPIHGLGPHTAAYHKYPNGREVLFANKADEPGGNGIAILDIIDGPTGGKVLKPLAFYMKGNYAADPDFPHDLDVQEHPLTHRTYAYVAYWNEGLVILYVTDPASPTFVSQSRNVPSGEEVQFHDVHPAPFLVDGKHYTITGPEIPTGQTSGHVRVWDTSDPAKPKLLSSWILPGRFVVTKPFQFTTHNFQFLPDGTIALAHGHAGVWLLNWTADPSAGPRAVGYYVPHASSAHAPSWAPVIGTPWVWGTGVDENGVLWAIDDETGIYGLSAG